MMARKVVRGVTFDAYGTLVLPRASVGTIYAAVAQRFDSSLKIGLADELDRHFPLVLKAAQQLSRQAGGEGDAQANRAFWTQAC